MKNKWHELIGPLGLIILIAIFVKLISVIFQFDLNFMNTYIENTGVWAPLFFIVAKASTLVFAPLTGAPLYILVGGFFGFTEGLLYVFIGDLIGFSILFFLGHRYGMRALSFLRVQPESKIFSVIEKGTQNLKRFIALGLSLFWFPELTIFVAGMSRLRYLSVMSIFMPAYTTATSLLVLLGAGVFGV